MAESSRHIIHEIYSDVMFELAEETGRIDEVRQDLAAVSKLLRQEPDFMTLLSSPRLKEGEKVQMIRRVFDGRVNAMTLDFLSVLARRNRVGFLPGIAGRYEDLYDETRNRKRVEVTVAGELRPEEIEALRARLKDAIRAEVKLTVYVDPTIVGGIVIRKGNVVIDNSVKSILDRTVKTVLSHSRDRAQKKEEE